VGQVDGEPADLDFLAVGGVEEQDPAAVVDPAAERAQGDLPS
jgi:hypothetical protein